jgi:hypothetical protein
MSIERKFTHLESFVRCPTQSFGSQAPRYDSMCKGTAPLVELLLISSRKLPGSKPILRQEANLIDKLSRVEIFYHWTKYLLLAKLLYTKLRLILAMPNLKSVKITKLEI